MTANETNPMCECGTAIAVAQDDEGTWVCVECLKETYLETGLIEAAELGNLFTNLIQESLTMNLQAISAFTEKDLADEYLRGQRDGLEMAARRDFELFAKAMIPNHEPGPTAGMVYGMLTEQINSGGSFDAGKAADELVKYVIERANSSRERGDE